MKTKAPQYSRQRTAPLLTYKIVIGSREDLGTRAPVVRRLGQRMSK
jgi:hypothetical protein